MARPPTAALVERLEGRRAEIEQTVLARVHAVDDPSATGDPEYVLGLKQAVNAALSFGFSALTGQADQHQPIPDELVAQARRAARSGVRLDTVLRRYVAGHALLDDFIGQEADAIGAAGQDLRHTALRAEANLLDRTIHAIAREYDSEVESRLPSSGRRRADCARKLLAGELVDPNELHYDLEGWHVGVVARGYDGESICRGLGPDLDRPTLVVRDADRVTWAWVGGLSPPDCGRLKRFARASRTAEVSISIGEPGRGVEGWRLTHRQAVAAAPIAAREASGVVDYGEVALVAAALRDDVLVQSLHQAYLAPLEAERDEGWALRKTLAAYFSAGQNVSSTAATLGVSRQTVNRRIRLAEEKIGQPLGRRAAEIETALSLAGLNFSLFANRRQGSPL